MFLKCRNRDEGNLEELCISQEKFYVSPKRRKVYIYEQYGASYAIIKLI